MIVGVPQEIKLDEYRVAMLPVGVEELVAAGHTVLVQAGAGLGSGIPDHEYLRQGAELVPSAEEIFGQAELVIKVKEPQPEEWPLLPLKPLLPINWRLTCSGTASFTMDDSPTMHGCKSYPIRLPN